MLKRDRLKIYDTKATGPQDKRTGRMPVGGQTVIYDGPSRNQFGAPEVVRQDGDRALMSDAKSFLPDSLATRDAIDLMRTGMPAQLTRGADGRVFEAQVVDTRQMDRRIRLELVSKT